MSKETKETKRSIGPAGASIVSEDGKKIKNTSKKIKKTIRGKNTDLNKMKNSSNKMLEKIMEEVKNEELIKKLDSMKYTPPTLTKEQALKSAMDRLLAKGGEVKKYKKGEAVKKNKMATTKGWGASRKT